MKICVVGSGLTGMLGAVAIKLHCPQHHVVMIDSDREPRNLGFGETCPPDILSIFATLLKVPEPELETWVSQWLIKTHSTIKYNFKWNGYLQGDDPGFYNGMPDMPDWKIIANVGHSTRQVSSGIVQPDHNSYKLFDLWYELYLAGRRKMSDFEGDINSFYWHCEDHTMIGIDNALVATSPSVNINSFEACDFLRDTYSHHLDEIVVGTVEDLVISDSGMVTKLKLNGDRELSADFFIDCSGFKRLFAKKFGLQLECPEGDILHNSAVVLANGYTENIDREMEPYASGYAMEYGYTWGIPLLDRKSYGYVYDSNFINRDQALEELATVSNPNTRTIDPINVSWTPGAYRHPWQKNFVLFGLAAGFVDPFDANVLATQFRQMTMVIKYLKDPMNKTHMPKNYNEKIWRAVESIVERVELHQGLAPKNSSEYWQRNHEVAKRKNLEDKVFEVINQYEHSPAARVSGDFIPYLNFLYLAEIIYYRIDMSRRCRKSSPEVLQLAEEYFKSHNNLNRIRSKVSPRLRDWYADRGIDFENYITFRK